MDLYEKDKIDKIRSLNLSGITWAFMDEDGVVDGVDKYEIIENILKDLEDSSYSSGD